MDLEKRDMTKNLYFCHRKLRILYTRNTLKKHTEKYSASENTKPNYFHVRVLKSETIFYSKE